MGKHGNSDKPNDGKLTKQQSDGRSGSQHGGGGERTGDSGGSGR